MVEGSTRRFDNEVNTSFAALVEIFTKDDFTKVEVIQSIKEYIFNFMHKEKEQILIRKCSVNNTIKYHDT